MAKKPKPGKPRPPRISGVVVALIDETGSMLMRQDETVVAYNTYLAGLQKSDVPIYLRTFKFDRFAGDPVVRSLTVSDTLASYAPQLSRENYAPRGNTPLYDATAYAIFEAERMQRAHNADRVTVMIQTDGEENASMEYSYERVRELITAKQAMGWEILFLAQGLGARGYHVARGLGIHHGSTMSYSGARGMSTNAFYAAGQNTANYVSGVAASAAFSEEQKTAAGDVFQQPTAVPSPPKPSK